MFLTFFIDFYRCFLQFFGFPSFRKNLDFFFRLAAEPKSLPPPPRQPPPRRPPRRFYALVLHGGVPSTALASPSSLEWSSDNSEHAIRAYEKHSSVRCCAEGNFRRRTSLYPSNFAPIAAKLRHRAFQKICKLGILAQNL